MFYVFVFSYTLAPYIYIYTVPLKFILFTIVVFLLLKNKKLIIIHKHLKYVVFVFYILFLSLFKSIIFSQPMMEYKNLLFGLVIMLSIPSIIRNKKHADYVINIIIIAVAVNSVFCIMEFLHISIILPLKNMMYSFSILNLNEKTNFNQWTFRTSGVYHSIFAFSYVQALAIPSTYSRILHSKGKKLLYIFCLVILILGLLATSNRSAIVSSIIGIYFLSSTMRFSRKISVIIFVTILITTTYVLIKPIIETNILFILSSMDGSDSRLTIWKNVLFVSLDYLFLGLDKDYTQAMLNNPSFNRELLIGNSVISPHNSILNILIRYGLLATSGYILLIILSIKDISLLIRKKILAREYRIYPVLVLSYVINSFFHNGSIITSIDLWIIFGLSYSVYNFKKTKVRILPKFNS
jgi:hypothetical protein